MDCIFCAIAKGEIPSDKVYEDDRIIAFRDLSPQAPVHILIIPKEHIKWALDINAENSDIISYIFEKVPQIAKEQGLGEGFRLVNNCGESAGQSVHHLHFHLLGGRDFTWPPG